MTVSALVSGGKDSIYAAYLAETQGWPVDELVVLRPEDPESMMFHTPNLDLVELRTCPMPSDQYSENAKADLEISGYPAFTPLDGNRLRKRSTPSIPVPGVSVGAAGVPGNHLTALRACASGLPARFASTTS